jgi:DnaJ-class molecular chaperone
LQILDLQPPLTTEIVRARYKELVKRHHPDTNDGDKASEEKFKQISQAYQTIMTHLSP